MRTVEESRRARLDQLILEVGSIAALNELLNLTRTDSTLSQYKNKAPNSKGGTPKNMGSDLARRLEAACKKPLGWMDNDPDLDTTRWPFGDRVDHKSVADLPADLMSEAVGALNEVLRRRAARDGEISAALTKEGQALVDLVDGDGATSRPRPPKRRIGAQSLSGASTLGARKSKA